MNLSLSKGSRVFLFAQTGFGNSGNFHTLALMSAFRFKQFAVAHDKCAMKVNTDGVLLGAWADVTGAKTILDIGTGPGVIALMAAQRNTEAIIDAIDIDADACKQAEENFEQSKWSERLRAIHSSLQQFRPRGEYDVIISNPPYFIDDYKTGNHQKDVAKHSVALSYEELLSGINKCLADTGKASIIIPAFHYSTITGIAEKENLFVNKVTDVVAVEGKSSYLTLLRLERNEKDILKTRITIQNGNGNFTEEYKSLTKEFYLKF